jgi:hypothetical protein
MRELSLQAASPFIVRVLMRAMREFSTYRFCLHWITFLCTFAVMESGPLVGCGGYARRRQGGTENHSRITKKRPANHCFDAVRVLQCLQTWNCCCIGSFTYHDFPERSDVRVSIDCSYLIFHQISAARKRKCREMEGNLRRLESGKLFATALSPQQRRRKALQIADRLHGHAQSRNRTRAIYFLSISSRAVLFRVGGCGTDK